MVSARLSIQRGKCCAVLREKQGWRPVFPVTLPSETPLTLVMLESKAGPKHARQISLASPFIILLLLHSFTVCVYSEVHVQIAHTQRSEDNMWETVLSFPHMSSRDWTQVPGLAVPLPSGPSAQPSPGLVKSLSLILRPSLPGGSRLRTKHIIFLKFFIILCVWVLRLYTTCMPNAHWGQKRASKPLDLELQMVLSCHVGTRHWSWILCVVIQGC